MKDAKNYSNAIEVVAEKLFNECEIETHDILDINGEYAKWDTASKRVKDYVRFEVVTVLNAVNYFRSQTCNDCAKYDADKCGGYPICSQFLPRELVEVEK